MSADCAAFSIEATRPGTDDVAALAALLPPGTAVYLSAVPGRPLMELVAPAMALRRAGLEPVPHLPARRLANLIELTELLSRLTGEAAVHQLMLIGGDVAMHGVFPETLSLIRTGMLERAGITAVGIAGYPEGHPRVAVEILAQALRDKLAAATSAGLRPHIVSQFSFAPDSVIAWLRALRAAGIAAPVKVGMAGPTNVPSLVRYAARCGVAASLRSLKSGLAANVIGATFRPDRLIEALASAVPSIGETAPHYFSFGGVAATAHYAHDKAADATHDPAAACHAMKPAS